MTVSRGLTKLGADVSFARNLSEALKKADEQAFDLVLLDVHLPDGNGIDAIPALLHRECPPLVIIMTAFSDPDGAELAIESGAWDYLPKPVSLKDLRLQVLRALEFQKQKKQAAACVLFDAPEIIGAGPAIRNCLIKAAQIVASDGNVLITGETGTGKELFARAIHENSDRRDGAFIVVDCSVLSETLIESVLFGHEKGAFTGADRTRKGLVALANGGTLFLDEVGELPGTMQSSFLRVLQEKAFRPVGSEKEVSSDFRVICATNRDLDQMAAQGGFRLDLLYRLKTFGLNLPPLRNRPEDIWPLASYQIEKACHHQQLPVKEVGPDFIETLKKYDWPGNVRELINTIEQSVTAARNEPTLFAFHLPAKIRAKLVRSRVGDGKAGPRSEGSGRFAGTHREVLDRVEQESLAMTYAAEGGDIQRMLHRTGLSRTVLYRKLKQHGIH